MKSIAFLAVAATAESAFGSGLGDSYYVFNGSTGVQEIPLSTAPSDPTLITDREGLAAITNNLDGVYKLGAASTTSRTPTCSISS